jgi:hypothetical protein
MEPDAVITTLKEREAALKQLGVNRQPAQRN